MTRGRKWFYGCGCVAFLLLYIVVIPGLGYFAGLEIPLALAVGWIKHPARTWPHLTWNLAGLATFALGLALTAWVGHRFASWLWKARGREDAWRPKWTIAGLALILLMFASGIALTGVVHQAGWLARSGRFLQSSSSNDRNASASLKTIATAQADFRSNDRDNNRVNDYWRKDIAGLAVLGGPEVANMIRLIEPSVAAADARPKIPTPTALFLAWQPKAGYWYAALRFADEKEPDPDRWAAATWPASEGSGDLAFIISHDGVMWKKQVSFPFSIEIFPADPAAEGWSKLD